MTEPAPKAELLRSLGRLVRGLSALFWGLPLALVLAAQAGTTRWLSSLGPFAFAAPVLALALLYYALLLMSDFQRQERVWTAALDQAKLLALVNVGLSPFLYWHHRLPDVAHFTWAVALLAVSGLLFLTSLNRLLWRLAAMLPDETIRAETAAFTRLNRSLLIAMPLLVLALGLAARSHAIPFHVRLALQYMEPLLQWFVLLLILVPVSITMSLLWKIKEAILGGVFGP